MARPERWTLAACYRTHQLSLALVRDGEVLEVRLHKVPAGYRERKLLQNLMRNAAKAYAVDRLVVEAGHPLTTIARKIHCKTSPLELSTAKQRLLGAGEHRHQDLFQRVLAHDPKLRRLVTVVPDTQLVARTRRRQTVQLLAIALALAGEQLFAARTARA